MRGINPKNAEGLLLARARTAGGPNLLILPGTETAKITNGTIELYVNPEGHLNTNQGCADGSDPTTNGDCQKGLLYVPTNTEATAPGCLCEGWGAGADGVSGFADIDAGGVRNIRRISFTEDGIQAVSRVAIDNGGIPWLEVTHDYHPSPATPNLYEATVTIKNVSGDALSDVRYSRAMDWDIWPTTFDEYSTIQGVGATNLLRSDNNGFETPDPYGSRNSFGALNVNVVDYPAFDQGAVFDFGFGALAPGEERRFNIFYGAASNEPDALTAITRVHAEVYSFGQPSHESDVCAGGGGGGEGGGGEPSAAVLAGSANNPTTCPPSPDHGTPNTFIFAFGAVGGVKLNTPPTTPVLGPPGFVYRANEGAPLCLNISASDPDGDPLSFVIDWGDGTSTTTTSTNPCHRYADGPRMYTGSLTVVADDGHGGVSPAAATNAAIGNVAPTVYRLKIDWGRLNVRRVGEVFWAEWFIRDPGTMDMPWKWTITWGDGTTTTGETNAQGEAAPIRTEHAYGSPGAKPVRFTVTDKDGASHSRGITVFITP